MKMRCKACLHDFSGRQAFDEHWRGKRVDARRQVCRDPESIAKLARDTHGRWTIRRQAPRSAQPAR